MADPLEMATALDVVAAEDAGAALDSAASPVVADSAVAVAPAVVASDHVDRKGSWAAAASVDSADQRGGCRPNRCQPREVVVLDPAVVGCWQQMDASNRVARRVRQVGTLVGAHLVAVARLPGWANRSWAGLSATLGAP